MTDPLGLLGSTPTPMSPPGAAPSARPPVDGPSFRESLEQEIARVNELQHDARVAAEDLLTGRRDDIESVMTAAKKADMAFRMLLQVRNKMMDAYEEVKQIRV